MPGDFSAILAIMTKTSTRRIALTLVAWGVGIAACGDVGEEGPGDAVAEVDAASADAGEGPDELVLTTDSLPPLHVYERYEAILEAEGGTPPYTFEASDLPPGLLVHGESGVIENNFFLPAIGEGTPREVAITVTDAAAARAFADLALEITAVEAVGAGSNHFCALDEDGAAWCWGNGSNGQLGQGEEEGSGVPMPVQGGHTFTAIDGGFSHTCALDDEGRAFCWGRNDSGELGTGSEGDPSSVPAEVSGGHTFTALAVGQSHTCAIDEDGDAHCWGASRDGRLGTGDENQENTPFPLPVAAEDDQTFTAITASPFHTCALDDDDRAWCWGDNQEGEIGNGEEDDPVFAPEGVVGDHAFVSISASARFTCAVDDEGDAYCWGQGSSGQLGGGDDGLGTGTLEPEEVLVGRTFDSITTGQAHTCAVADDDTAWCWGRNDQGQIGSGEPDSDNNSVIPEPVVGDIAFTSIAAAARANCGVDLEGLVWCWGENDGKLGNDGISQSAEPVLTHPSRPVD